MKLLRIALCVLAVAIGATGAQANVFRWAADTDPASMDPYSRNVTATFSFLQNVYEPLVRRDRELKLEPALSTGWRNTAPDTWRFELRRNVRFHGGEPFTADDVVFSFERARGPTSLIRGTLSSVKEIRKVDDFTVELVTNLPNPILPSELTNWLIMSRAWAQQHNVLQATNLASNEQSYAVNNANGTGPFRLRSRNTDGRAVLEVNRQWWDTAQHNLTEVHFTPLANPATRSAALLSGEIDMVYGLPIANVAQVRARPNLRVLTTPETRTMYFGMDVARDELLDSDIRGRNPFKDLRVRQAMRIAIDADAIVNNVMRGFGVVNYIMAGPGIEGFEPAINVGPERDLNRARQLLTEAGYPNGFEVGMHCSNDRYVNDEAVCTAVVGLLARINVRVRLRTMPFAQYVRLVSPPYETSFFYVGWSASTYDSHNTLLNLLATRAPGSPRGVFNVGGWSNARLDQLTDQVLTELDQNGRRGMIREALVIARDDVATIPIMQQVVVWGAKDNIDLVLMADNVFAWRYVRVR